MREVKTIGKYLGHGSRAQVHTAIAGEEGVALKIYRGKAFFEQEMEAYEHIRQNNPSPSLKLPQYFGTFSLTESALSSFKFNQIDKRRHPNVSYTPHRVALGFEEFSGVGLYTIIEDLKPSTLTRLEKGLLKTLRALHNIGICHGDIKANNILLNPIILEDEQRAALEYMVIDLSDAVLKHKTSERRWARLQKDDLIDMRGIFHDARAEKAAKLGFCTLSNILPSGPSLNKDTIKQPAIDIKTQLKLSRLLRLGYSASSIQFLAREILQVTTSLIPELCLVVVRILHKHGQLNQALALVEEHLTNATTKDGPCPYLSHQKGSFEYAIAQFNEQLGPLNNTTLCSRYDYAMFRVKISDYNIAREIFNDILTILAGVEVPTRKQVRIRNTTSMEMKDLERYKDKPDSSILAVDRQNTILSSKRKYLSKNDSGIDLRSPKRLYCNLNRE
ncbi:hypothetical protein EYC84_011120 [Monilinia fructicola]|uniref:Protein kinase domain-containing protein n=1 Tax=Monilinia fructicola TaxID=38448 RepID=A0A5M9J765_MONFR|nr:hypothetical protein EYC84_011120 [Monilinia fructicola]